MKTYKEFRSNIDEGIGAAIGLGLTAWSGYNAIKNLSKGKYKAAAWDAVGAVPGGKVFKGMKALGSSKKLAKLGSFTQSSLRHGSDNAFSRATSPFYDLETYKKAWNKGKNLYNKMKGKTKTNTKVTVPDVPMKGKL